MELTYLAIIAGAALVLLTCADSRKRPKPRSHGTPLSVAYQEQLEHHNPTQGLVCPLSIERPLPDYYALLGVPEEASSQQIEQRYRQMVALAHPDLFGHDSLARNEAERELKLLNETMAVLRDPVRRHRYDAIRTPRPLHERLARSADRQQDLLEPALQTAGSRREREAAIA
jgi:hypothetical protein